MSYFKLIGPIYWELNSCRLTVRKWSGAPSDPVFEKLHVKTICEKITLMINSKRPRLIFFFLISFGTRYTSCSQGPGARIKRRKKNRHLIAGPIHQWFNAFSWIYIREIRAKITQRHLLLIFPRLNHLEIELCVFTDRF